jgi:hypothetical protein
VPDFVKVRPFITKPAGIAVMVLPPGIVIVLLPLGGPPDGLTGLQSVRVVHEPLPPNQAYAVIVKSPKIEKFYAI